MLKRATLCLHGLLGIDNLYDILKNNTPLVIKHSQQESLFEKLKVTKTIKKTFLPNEDLYYMWLILLF